MNSRTSHSGLTGLELLAVLAVFGAVLWIAKPALEGKLQSRKIEKTESKIADQRRQTDAQDDQQLEAAHTLIVGTNAAIGSIPDDMRTPASDLAGDLSLRAISALTFGRNTALDPVLDQSIRAAVRQVLSPIIEENVRGRKTIEDLTGRLGESVGQEKILRASIDQLNRDKDALVTEKLATAARIELWVYWAKIALCGYALVAWVLPVAAKHFPVLAPFARGGQWLVSQAGGAAMSTLTATVKGIENVRTRLKQGDVAPELRKEIDRLLAEEIYDNHDARIQQIRREEKLV